MNNLGTVQLSFYGDIIPIETPKNYLLLLNAIQGNFGIEPDAFDKLELKVLIKENNNTQPKVIELNEDLYNTLIQKYRFLQIELEINENKKPKEEPKVDEKAKNEIMSKIIEDTKKRIRMKNEEIISESKIIEPKISNEFENIIKNKLDTLTKEIIRDSQISVQKLESQYSKQLSSKVDKSNQLSIHNVLCRGCSAFPIKGIRYKCTICNSFDYCEECEMKHAEMHKHPFYKIRFPLDN